MKRFLSQHGPPLIPLAVASILIMLLVLTGCHTISGAARGLSEDLAILSDGMDAMNGP